MYFMALGKYDHLRYSHIVLVRTFILTIEQWLNSTLPVGTEGLEFINTSMHGVSDPFVRRAFDTFGISQYIPVMEQRLPDPEFPTVKFPNPEEKGALVRSRALGERIG